VTMMKGDTPTQFPGEIDENHRWAEGDNYITRLQTYIDAYELFINPPPPPPTQAELDAQKLQDLVDAADAAEREVTRMTGNTPEARAYRAEKARQNV